ncbi:MAG: RsmE family RNA methyltransferase, partial [Bacteroidota bacterium]
MSIFYQKTIESAINSLSEEESRHCVSVLRYQEGDEIIIFDGKGGKHRSTLTKVSKKKCEFEIVETNQASPKKFRIHLAIAPTKSMDRMEWLIEKLVEFGVDEVTLLETNHSERRKLRMDRLEKKAIGAMKQSGNPFLITINPITKLTQFIAQDHSQIKLMAHVDSHHAYIGDLTEPNKQVSILIGPEGDFSTDEVKLAS